MDIFYLPDISLNSFYTAVYFAFNNENSVITSRPVIQLSLGDNVITIQDNRDKSEYVRQAVANCDRNAEEDIMLALRSCDIDKEQKTFNYIKRLIKTKMPIKKRLSLNEVVDFNDLLYKVTGELHRLKGFLRFIECDNKIMYAPCSPDNNIIDLLAYHFKRRLAAEKFAIHDVNRKIATIYDGEKLVTGSVGDAEIYISEQEKQFENLWKKYYKSINIENRPHEKQMKGYMPVRYWKFLPEKQD